MASGSFARQRATRRPRAAAAATAAATPALLPSGPPTALIGAASSCPGAMWLAPATGSRPDSESDEENLPVGDEVCKRGYLRKKHGHRRYFVLRLETADSPARLEYYENARKFRHSVRAAAAAAAAAASGSEGPEPVRPRRVIALHQCLAVSQRADARCRRLIALFTRDESLALLADSQADQESWYALLSRLILESRRRGGAPSARPAPEGRERPLAALAEPPYYRDVWQVTVKPRGLGHRKELSGVFRLCLTDEEVVFVRLNAEVASVVVQLLSIRRCGHTEQYFFLEVGRSTVIGPGELWMQVDDRVVARHMHELFLEKMRALCAEEYRARCRSYTLTIGAHLLTLLSARRHLGKLPGEPGGWFRRNRLEQSCHVRALGELEQERLAARREQPPSEPGPQARRGRPPRPHLPRALRARRAVSVPASCFRRFTPSPPRAPERAPAPADGGAHLVSERSSPSPGPSGEEDPEGKEEQAGSEGDYMPMNKWGSGNGRGAGGGQGPCGQSPGGNQCSGGAQGSGGGQGSSGNQGSSGQSSGGQGAGGNQCAGQGQGAGGHGSSGGQGAGGGPGAGSGQGPRDGPGSGSGKNSGGGKGSGSGKGSGGGGEQEKPLKKKSYFGKLTQSKHQRMPLPPPPPPPPTPSAGATGGKGKSGGRFRLYFCATKERKEVKEGPGKEAPEGGARALPRARAVVEEDPYVPMRPGAAAPLASCSDYVPMAPQHPAAARPRRARSPLEDSRGYMMMFPRVSPAAAPEAAKEDESKDDSDSDYMFMAPGAGAIPKQPPSPRGGSAHSWSSYFSLPSARGSPLGQTDHSDYVPMLNGTFWGKGPEQAGAPGGGRPKDGVAQPAPRERGCGPAPGVDTPCRDQAQSPEQLVFVTQEKPTEAGPPEPTRERRECDSASVYVNIDFTDRTSHSPAPADSRGALADPGECAVARSVNIHLRLPLRRPESLSELFRAIPGASLLALDLARWPRCSSAPGGIGLEGTEYIEVRFRPAMPSSGPFADSALRYDAETGRIYVVDPFSDCCMDVALSPRRCSEPPPVARRRQEEPERRRPPRRAPSSASARAAVPAFPADGPDRNPSAWAAAPTLAVGPALAAASALAAAPGIGSAAAGMEVAAGFDSASVRWFQLVANAAGAEAGRAAQEIAGGPNRRAPNPFEALAGGENAAHRAAAPPVPPPRRRVPRPPVRDESDDDDTYVRMDFSRADNDEFDAP